MKSTQLQHNNKKLVTGANKLIMSLLGQDFESI